jgi:hypothetical protein
MLNRDKLVWYIEFCQEQILTIKTDEARRAFREALIEFRKLGGYE